MEFMRQEKKAHQNRTFLSTRLLLQKSFILMIFFITGFRGSGVMASPVVTIPQDRVMSTCCHVVVPIQIAGFSDVNIGGYSLRLNYDDNLLTEPELVTENTLSEGSDEVKLIIDPLDGVGNLSLGIFDFTPNQKDILISLRFRVSADFSGDSPFITFVNPNRKTVLFNSSFEEIDAVFKPSLGDLDGDGSIDLSDAVTGLKTLVNIENSSLQLASETDGDKKIGVRDVIYILRFLSES